MGGERARLIAPTIQALSERHGGHTVALLTVDADAGTATPVAVHDPDPEARHELTHLLGASIPLAGTVCGLACEVRRPVELGSALPGSPPDEMLPDGWLRFARRHALGASVVVPVERDGSVIGLLVTARRSSDPLAIDTLAALVESAGRLGQLLPDPDGTGIARAEPLRTGEDRSRPLDLPIDLVLGLAFPVLLAAAGALTDTPNAFRPVSALLLVCTALGLLRNRRTAAACAGAGFLVVWFWFTAPYGSFGIGSTSDLVGLAMTALTLAGVQVLLQQVESNRRRREERTAVVDAMVGRLPLGFGLFDLDRRFLQLNDQLARLDGVALAEHLGRRPGDVNPLTGELYEHLVERVARTGEALVDQLVSFDMTDTGLTHTWRLNLFPVVVGGRPTGVGTTIEDVTDEVVVRRRAQLMLRLARTVAGATRREQVAQHAVDVLSEGLKARCAFAVATGDLLAVQAVAGYRSPAAARCWAEYTTRRDEPGDLVTSMDASELVIATVQADDPSVERQLHRAVENVTIAWQPVTLPGDDQPSAAIGVAWPYRRQLTEHSRTLLQTAASVIGLALARIELTEQTERDRFRTAMDAMIDQVILMHTVRGADGTIEDLEVDFANATGREAAGGRDQDLIGWRVTDLYPRSRTSGMFERLCDVVETGVPWVVDRLPYADVRPDGEPFQGYWNLQVVKVGDGCIVASRDVTEVVEAERLAEEAREVAQRERIAVDLLQRATLPRSLPDLDNVELTAHYRPARRDQPVGGDWYDAFALDDGTLALIIADVAGDGPEAAGTMVQVRNIFRALATEGHDPGDVLARVDAVLHRVGEPQAPFVTACFATLDPRDGSLRWASAGHLPPIISRAGGEVEVARHAPGPPLHSLLGRSYPESRTTLGDGDLVVLFTDGLVERRGEVIDVGLERLRRQIADRPVNACRAVAELLAEALEDPADDTAILCAQYRAVPHGRQDA